MEKQALGSGARVGEGTKDGAGFGRMRGDGGVDARHEAVQILRPVDSILFAGVRLPGERDLVRNICIHDLGNLERFARLIGFDDLQTAWADVIEASPPDLRCK